MRKTYLEWVEIVNNLAYDEVLVDMLSDWQADGLFRTDCINKLEARIAELEAESERFTAHDATERQDDKLPEREVCEACGGDGTLLLVDNYKGQATATVDCPYCNGTGRVNKECEE